MTHTEKHLAIKNVFKHHDLSTLTGFNLMSNLVTIESIYRELSIILDMKVDIQVIHSCDETFVKRHLHHRKWSRDIFDTVHTKHAFIDMKLLYPKMLVHIYDEWFEKNAQDIDPVMKIYDFIINDHYDEWFSTYTDEKTKRSLRAFINVMYSLCCSKELKFMINDEISNFMTIVYQLFLELEHELYDLFVYNDDFQCIALDVDMVWIKPNDDNINEFSHHVYQLCKILKEKYNIDVDSHMLSDMQCDFSKSRWLMSEKRKYDKHKKV